MKLIHFGLVALASATLSPAQLKEARKQAQKEYDDAKQLRNQKNQEADEAVLNRILSAEEQESPLTSVRTKAHFYNVLKNKHDFGENMTINLFDGRKANLNFKTDGAELIQTDLNRDDFKPQEYGHGVLFELKNKEKEESLLKLVRELKDDPSMELKVDQIRLFEGEQKESTLHVDSDGFDENIRCEKNRGVRLWMPMKTVTNQPMAVVPIRVTKPDVTTVQNALENTKAYIFPNMKLGEAIVWDNCAVPHFGTVLEKEPKSERDVFVISIVPVDY